MQSSGGTKRSDDRLSGFGSHGGLIEAVNGRTSPDVFWGMGKEDLMSKHFAESSIENPGLVTHFVRAMPLV